MLRLLSIIEISQFTRLSSADSCASIFQISCSFTVFVGTFRMDCIDGVCIFLSTGIAGWLKISERSYWEFSSPIFEWFDSVRLERSSSISSSFSVFKANLILGPSLY